ncbi:MAG: PQQ-binding-like beta-propeller repeat protein [Phycisphaerae bacterium]
MTGIPSKPIVSFGVLVGLFAGGSLRPARGQPPASGEKAAGASYLNTSFEAKEALSRARKHVRRGNWPAAATAFQEIGERYGDYLTKRDGERFLSIRRFVNETISGWPEAGRSAYRTAFEAIADGALAAALKRADIEALARIADRYYATRAGASALDAAAELAIERGDFASARQWYARLLATHPDREHGVWRWRAKRALCEAWEGRAARLRKLRAELAAAPDGPRVSWAGRDQPLLAFVDEMLRQIDTGTAVAPDSHGNPQIFCGGPDRRAFFETTAVAEARLWRFSDFEGPRPAENGVERDTVDEDRRHARLRSIQSGRLVAGIPVSGDGLLFVHDARTVWAIDPLRTQAPAWRFDLSPPAAAEPRWINEDEPPEQFTSLFANGRLYVDLERRASAGDADETRRASSLFCLDAKTGRLLWQNNLADVGSRFEDVRLDGAPLLHNGKLFAVVRRRKAFGFEACLLLCIDPETGRLQWKTHVGEAPTGSYGYYRPTRAHAAAAGDLVFVPTNLGTVAAVSATTGRVAWLRCYRSRFAEESEGTWPTRFGRPIRSWQYQPAIVWGDAVVCMPLDLETILVLDQNDGRLRRRIPLASLFNPEMLVGLAGDRLYTLSGELVCYDLAADKIAWQRPLAEGQPLGRGAVTTNGVFIPTHSALLQYPLEGGPARVHRWALEDAGNILPLPDQLVVASAGSLFGLVGRREAFARLTDRMNKRPRDDRAALAVANLAFKTGAYQRGLDAVAEAVRRLGGPAGIREDQTRRRLFNRLLQFADALLASPTNLPEDARPERRQVVMKLLDLAGGFAVDIESRVSCRLLSARTRLLLGNTEAALAIYQQILAEKPLRRHRMRVRPEDYPPGFKIAPEVSEAQPQRTVAMFIEDWIDRLLAEHGRDCYSAVEQQARKRLKLAEADDDLDAILEVAEAFPNSRTAPVALAAHARRARARRVWPAAVRSYRRAIRGAAAADRPMLLREFVACLLESGRAEEASQWLERGERDYADYRFEAGGRSIGFAAWRRLLLAADNAPLALATGHDGRPGRPRVRWPLLGTRGRLFADRVAVLEPRFPDLPDTGWDAVLTYAGGQLDAERPATGRSIWPRRVACPAQPVLLGMDSARFVLADAHRLFALTRTSGQLAWQFGRVPAEDPGADPESMPAWTQHALTPAHLVSASDNGELACLDPADGTLRWRRRIGESGAEALAANDRHVFCAQWSVRHNLIHVLDVRTGQTIHTVRIEEARPVQLLVPDPEGMLLVVLTRSILSIDPDRGAIRWRADTRERFVPASLAVDAEGVFLSDDDRRITKFDLYDGRVLWQTAPIGNDFRDGLWVAVAGGRLLVASSDTLAAFDTADGRRLWAADAPPGLRLQTPIVLADAIVGLSPAPSAADADHPPDGVHGGEKRFLIRRYDLRTGRALPAARNGPLLTEPIAAFGGLFVRNQSLLLLDGNRLIGYVGSAEDR